MTSLAKIMAMAAFLALALVVLMACNPCWTKLKLGELRLKHPDSCMLEVLRKPFWSEVFPINEEPIGDRKLTLEEVVIHPNLPPFSFRGYWHVVHYGGEIGYNLDALAISRKNEGSICQRIETDDGTTPFWNEEPTITFLDMNFDGYKDLKILTSYGSGGLFFEIWLFNPEHECFEFDKELSALGNPEPDAQRQEITECHRTYLEGPGGISHSWNRYQFISGKLTLVETGDVIWDAMQDCYVETISKYKDGKKQIVSRQPWGDGL